VDHRKKVVVFIPALNEADGLPQLFAKLKQVFSPEQLRHKDYVVETVVVDDGSTDNTRAIAKQYATAVISHPRNMGLGAATRSAMEYARDIGADAAVKLDADFQHDPEDIEKVIMPILRGETDLCWGSRFTGQITYRMPWVRWLGNHTFTWLMNVLTEFKISDAQTGLMAFGKRYLQVFEIRGSYNPPQQLLLDANLKCMRYAEVPVVFHARKTGKSFISFRYPVHVCVNLFRILVYANPLRVFGFIGFLFIVMSVLHSGTAMIAKYYHLVVPEFLLDKGLRLAMLIVGIQSFYFGILADMILRDRASRYLVRQVDHCNASPPTDDMEKRPSNDE